MKNKNQEKTFRILAIVLVIVAVILATFYVSGKMRAKETEQAMEDLAVSAEEPEDSISLSESEPEESHDILAELGIEVPEKNLDWSSLWETNPDIYAWIYIPGTNVDYPILQSPTDDYYYLDHNLDGSEGYPGCLYTEMANSKEFTDYNTVIYGHNMRNGSMFASLHDYEEEEFFNENRYCYIYLPDGTTLVYDIFGAYMWSNEHILNTYTFKEAYQFAGYLTDVFGVRDMNKHFREGVNVTSRNHIVTLSTCIGGKPDHRYLVQGVLVNDPQLSYEEQTELYSKPLGE